MASIVQSSRKSVASVFDLFGVTTESAVELIRTGAKGISMLDAKADVMHTRVLTNCAIQKVALVEEELMNAARTHCEKLEEFHRFCTPNVQFDRGVNAVAALDRFKASLTAN